MNKRTLILSQVMTAMLVLGAPAASRAEGAGEKPLFERLGGVGPLSVVVDEFIDRLAVDKILNANPAIRDARARVPKAYLKFHVTTLVCQVTGGPCKYTGRSMKESHAHLNITEKEWAEMATVFKSVLDKYKVPAKEQQELFAIVGTTKADIVAAAPKVDAKKMAQHLEKDITYPASKAQLLGACDNLSDFSPEEKTWFASHLPDRTFASAKDVMKAVGLR